MKIKNGKMCPSPKAPANGEGGVSTTYPEILRCRDAQRSERSTASAHTRGAVTFGLGVLTGVLVCFTVVAAISGPEHSAQAFVGAVAMHALSKGGGIEG
ncbi:MAG: hypothetical protein ACKVXR_11595 [Planctomycetota bacterium]